jgi:hypothetical protein
MFRGGPFFLGGFSERSRKRLLFSPDAPPVLSAALIRKRDEVRIIG